MKWNWGPLFKKFNLKFKLGFNFFGGLIKGATGAIGGLVGKLGGLFGKNKPKTKDIPKKSTETKMETEVTVTSA